MAESEDEVRLDAGEAERPRSDEIREQIEETRIELEETVDAIGEKLRPRRLAQEGWQAVKNTSGNGASRIARMVREHPIPIGLIGMGVTWLMIENRRRGREDWSAYGTAEDYPDLHDDTTYASGGDYTGVTEYGTTGAVAEGRSRVAEAKGAVAEAASRVSEKASGAAHRVAEAASHAGSKVGEVAGNVKQKAADLGRRTGYQARRAREGYWDLVERRPMSAGLATLAAGMLVGLLVPSTRRENRLMGETRDELLGRAREAGRETFEKTKDVARSAVDAAQDAAKTAAREEARRQDLGKL